jgi:hypothetical protein
LRKDMALTNRLGTEFDIRIDRKVTLLDRNSIEKSLKTAIGGDIQTIAYESENSLSNTGKTSWTRKGGAPAIWILGMLRPSPQTVVVLPILKKKGDRAKLLNDHYFGDIPGDRWKIVEDHAFLKADGRFRGKVGIPPQHVTNFIGSYDAEKRVLTLLQCDWSGTPKDFVNSAWEDQKEPFSGDAFNAYNDGPLKDGSQMGPFYEVESLSPAAFLSPGKALTHLQITYHLQGDETELSRIAKQILGVDLREIAQVFSK